MHEDREVFNSIISKLKRDISKRDQQLGFIKRMLRKYKVTETMTILGIIDAWDDMRPDESINLFDED